MEGNSGKPNVSIFFLSPLLGRQKKGEAREVEYLDPGEVYHEATSAPLPCSFRLFKKR